jgi:hypothetical protein
VFRSWDIIRNLDGVGLNTRVDDIHDRGTWAVNIEVPSIGVHRSEEPASPPVTVLERQYERMDP